jgi:hypothetical protein
VTISFVFRVAHLQLKHGSVIMILRRLGVEALEKWRLNERRVTRDSVIEEFGYEEPRVGSN